MTRPSASGWCGTSRRCCRCPPVALRGLRDARRPGLLAVAGALPGQRLLGADGLRPPRGAGARLRRGGGDRLRRRGDRPPSPLLRARGRAARAAALPGRCSSARPARWTRPPRWPAGSCPKPSWCSAACWRRAWARRAGGNGSRCCGCWRCSAPRRSQAGVGEALRLGAIGFDAVKHLVLCRIERRPPRLDLEVYPYLPRAQVATTSARAYLALLARGPAMSECPHCPAERCCGSPRISAPTRYAG